MTTAETQEPTLAIYTHAFQASARNPNITKVRLFTLCRYSQGYALLRAEDVKVPTQAVPALLAANEGLTLPSFYGNVTGQLKFALEVLILQVMALYPDAVRPFERRFLDFKKVPKYRALLPKLWERILQDPELGDVKGYDLYLYREGQEPELGTAHKSGATETAIRRFGVCSDKHSCSGPGTLSLTSLSPQHVRSTKRPARSFGLRLQPRRLYEQSH